MTVQEIKKAPKPRYSGILVHPTSFPSPYGIGDLGDGAYAFIDFLYDAGQTLWQCLPLGPTGFGDSPYQAFSAFAGQPLIISPDLLKKDGLLDEKDLADVPDFNTYSVEYGNVITYKTALLHKAHTNFLASEDKTLTKAFNHFCRTEKSWLEDYALFMSLKDLHQGRSWHEWEPQYQTLDAKTRKTTLIELADSISYYQFIQFIFFKQWHALKLYANKKGISVIGDIPIFVSPDSADVWANQSLFKLDSKGYPTAVAGVPPDYFSKTGQLWGNPLYNWTEHKKTGYAWWIARIRQQLQLVDYLRIDHFRGFEAYWSVPYGDETAINGKWVKGPGASLFRAIEKELGKGLPIFAEDLGVITPQVEKLRDTFHFPGMKVLQFAFNDTAESDFLPYLYSENCICYTGTHDNDTTVGWYLELDEKYRDKVRRYMNCDGSNIHWDFIRTALGSTARYAIFPLQDLFGFGSDCRMNTPGAAAGNWAWRYTDGKLSPELAEALKTVSEVYGRDRARMEVKSMIRTILVLLFLLCFFIISIPLYLIEAIIGHFDIHKKERSSFIIVTTALKIIIWLSGIHLIVKGREKVPKDQAVLYVSNHRSYFDIVTLYPLTNNTTGFVAKKELERIPFIRRWMRYMNCQFLDRENIKEGLKTILNCIATVKNGCSICIFPEGTRTPGDEMLEFKEGSFKIAEKSGCLIIPVAITNTENVFENHIPFIKASTVIIEFGDPIDLKALPKEERRHIGSQVQGIIGNMLKENSLANVES